ncbi:MAG: hypothetical protein CW346_17740 [Bacillaceae bacterium]|nr:hypothetical protein [Bacillaceae bacterium]
MNEDELRRLLDEVIREGVDDVVPLTGPAFGTTFHIYPVPGGDEVDVRVRIKQRHLPRLLSGLKLEDVEKAICHVIAYEGVPPRVPVERFVGLITERLRQQVNGDTCTREEG